MARIKREVILGRELYEFTSFDQWRAHAAEWSKACDVPQTERIAIDSIGRICFWETDLKRANKDGTFPVTVYCTASKSQGGHSMDQPSNIDNTPKRMHAPNASSPISTIPQYHSTAIGTSTTRWLSSIRRQDIRDMSFVFMIFSSPYMLSSKLASPIFLIGVVLLALSRWEEKDDEDN